METNKIPSSEFVSFNSLTDIFCSLNFILLTVNKKIAS